MTGLSNLGNTCFMNVVLQILCHTEPLQQYFVQPLISPMSPNVTSATLAIPDRAGRVTRQSLAKHREISIWTEFCELVHEMWTTRLQMLTPDSFLESIWKVVPMFRGYQQQDAQEFIRYLIDKMHLELSSRKGRTIIMQSFQGSLFNEVTCLEC
eukprot:jgi/Hompol1/3593/HPOL_002590-RA